MRVSVQLVGARTDATLWADRYDRQLADILDLQSDLAATVAREIAIQLTPSEAARLRGRGPVDPEVHLEVLKSRHSAFAGSRDAAELAVRHARRALELDPNHAPAWSALADCQILRVVRGMAPPADAGAEAAAAARRSGCTRGSTRSGRIRATGRWCSGWGWTTRDAACDDPRAVLSRRRP